MIMDSHVARTCAHNHTDTHTGTRSHALYYLMMRAVESRVVHRIGGGGAT